MATPATPIAYKNQFPINYGGGSYTTNQFRPIDTPDPTTLDLKLGIAGTNDYYTDTVDLTKLPQYQPASNNTAIIAGAAGLMLLIVIMNR